MSESADDRVPIELYLFRVEAENFDLPFVGPTVDQPVISAVVAADHHAVVPPGDVKIFGKIRIAHC